MAQSCMHKMVAYVLSGIPCSGKTTLAKQLAEKTGAVLHSVDDVADSWGCQDVDGKIRSRWINNIKVDLQNGKSVICDSLALNSLSRRWILGQISAFDCKKILAVKVVPVDECIRRNENRAHKVSEEQIQMTARFLEPPADDEGWDVIYVDRE